MNLLLQMYGPLQSYGTSSKNLLRRTDRSPSKSAIVGMFCAGLGINAKNLSGFPIQLRDLNNLLMAVRIEHPDASMDIDYQITRDTLRVKEGINKDPVVTKRQYIVDGRFLVAMDGPLELLKIIEHALKNPRWQLSMGRKCCPTPFDMVVGIFDEPDVLKFISTVPWRKMCNGIEAPNKLEVLIDSKMGEIKQDVMLTLNEPKKYAVRKVEHHWFDLPLVVERQEWLGQLKEQFHVFEQDCI